jgi:hypothetical protein
MGIGSVLTMATRSSLHLVNNQKTRQSDMSQGGKPIFSMMNHHIALNTASQSAL